MRQLSTLGFTQLKLGNFQMNQSDFPCQNV